MPNGLVLPCDSQFSGQSGILPAACSHVIEGSLITPFQRHKNESENTLSLAMWVLPASSFAGGVVVPLRVCETCSWELIKKLSIVVLLHISDASHQKTQQFIRPTVQVSFARLEEWCLVHAPQRMALSSRERKAHCFVWDNSA